jgi:hypothetical protein
MLFAALTHPTVCDELRGNTIPTPALPLKGREKSPAGGAAAL